MVRASRSFFFTNDTHAFEGLVVKLQQPNGSIFKVKQRLPRLVRGWVTIYYIPRSLRASDSTLNRGSRVSFVDP